MIDGFPHISKMTATNHCSRHRVQYVLNFPCIPRAVKSEIVAPPTPISVTAELGKTRYLQTLSSEGCQLPLVASFQLSILHSLFTLCDIYNIAFGPLPNIVLSKFLMKEGEG